jgi:predicted metal-binding membrane protein
VHHLEVTRAKPLDFSGCTKMVSTKTGVFSSDIDCWALMLLLFVGGVMNLRIIAAIEAIEP